MRLLVAAIVLMASSVMCDVNVRIEEDFLPTIEEIFTEGDEAVMAIDQIIKMEGEQQEVPEERIMEPVAENDVVSENIEEIKDDTFTTPRPVRGYHEVETEEKDVAEEDEDDEDDKDDEDESDESEEADEAHDEDDDEDDGEDDDEDDDEYDDNGDEDDEDEEGDDEEDDHSLEWQKHGKHHGKHHRRHHGKHHGRQPGPHHRGRHHHGRHRPHHGKHHPRPHHGKHHPRPHHRGKHHPRPPHHGKHHPRPPHHGKHHPRPPHHGKYHPRPRPPHPRRRWNCKKHIGETIKPKFCGKSKCPSYKLAACGWGYEKRCYGPSTWAMVKMPKTKTDRKASPFMKLFKYISGYNDGKEKIKMAVPVLQVMKYNITDHTIKSGMAFWLNVRKAPAPKDPTVKVRTFPGKCAFVRSFGGRVKSGSRQMWKQVLMLSKALKKQKQNYAKGVSALAQYNAPWKIFGRHNEVWRWEKKSDESDDVEDITNTHVEEEPYITNGDGDEEAVERPMEEMEPAYDDTTEVKEETKEGLHIVKLQKSPYKRRAFNRIWKRQE